MVGLTTLVKVMDLVKSRLQAQFDFRIVLTMYDARTALSRRVQSQVWNNFGERALKTVIPRSVRMAEAPSKGLPGVIYRPKNPASDRKSTRLNSSHTVISYAVFCLKKK